MAVKTNQIPEVDLDSTDRLAILAGVRLPDVPEEAERADDSTTPGAPAIDAGATADLMRPAPVDRPSLAESVRSIEARIEQQNAEFEALSRSHEHAREAESAANARALALEQELGAARSALESEQVRSRDVEKMLAEKGASVDTAAVQELNSLAERDAQLAVLQLQYAKMLPALEERARTAAKLQADLGAAQAELSAISAELKSSQAQNAALDAQLKRREFDLSTARTDSAVLKTQAGSYLELLRTREWRRGFDLNMFREMDARVGAADTGREAVQAECDQLRGQISTFAAKIAGQNAAIEKLQAAAAAHAAAFAQQGRDLKLAEQARTEWAGKLKLSETECVNLNAELEARDRALAEALAAATAETQRVAQLESEAAICEEEMTVLMAHLQEARRPIQEITSDIQRMRDELAAKAIAIKDLTEEGEKLRAALERTRLALEERELLIRRLERSESNNATALGRIQTSMERMGSAVVPAPAPAPAVVPVWCPELVRIDGDKNISHALAPRTRIGRAPGCELHIDSSSVSRHHALILTRAGETIIEDLNSTNGVVVNGRHVTRQVLSDGDLLTIGEIQFRYVEKPVRRPAESQSAGPAAEHAELATTRPPGAESPPKA